MVMIHSQTMRGFVNRDLYFYPLTRSELSVNTHICSDSSERSNGAEEVCRKSVCRKSVCNEERPNLGGQKKTGYSPLNIHLAYCLSQTSPPPPPRPPPLLPKSIENA